MTHSVSESRISLARTLFALGNRFPNVQIDELLELRFRVRRECNALFSHQMVKAVWDRASPAKRVVRELQRLMAGPMLRRHWLFAAATGLAEFVAVARDASQDLREEGDRLIAAIPRTKNNQPWGPNTKVMLPVDDWQFVSALGVVGAPILSRPRIRRRTDPKQKRRLHATGPRSRRVAKL